MIICGTGHRPNKLGGYGEEAWDKLFGLADKYLEQRSHRIDQVISGGALGWDQALAQAAFSNNIPYVMALPFKGFDARWPEHSRRNLAYLCDKAHHVVYVCEEGYAPWKMQKRNAWMVDNADHVVALWDGSSGGTSNCVAYATLKDKPITNLWSDWIAHERQG